MFGFGKSKKKNEPENKKGISNFAQQIMILISNQDIDNREKI